MLAFEPVPFVTLLAKQVLVGLAKLNNNIRHGQQCVREKMAALLALDLRVVSYG